MSVRVKVITIRSEEGSRDNREEGLSGVVESALHILNFSQTQFQFESVRAKNKPSRFQAEENSHRLDRRSGDKGIWANQRVMQVFATSSSAPNCSVLISGKASWPAMP